ncbi:hypothetical protein O181_131538 [Austropuccinia psidii MF-1]|uniref:Uncharacterized protein n=1 Tax=Austropuccinia psidii MF-1 TaxID=1389203 RepID=A0A9Q3L0P7_9BASI|nr:hypothetical protein [Austropuccinia psidii MF-1]
MSYFALSIYIDESSCEVIAILHGGYCYTIHCIPNIDLNSSATRISLPTLITPFSGSALGWPQSRNPLPTINGHHSPPALVESIICQPAATSIGIPALDSISISATTDSNCSSELRKLFNVFNHLFRHYCCNFYAYVQNHPDNAGNYYRPYLVFELPYKP